MSFIGRRISLSLSLPLQSVLSHCVSSLLSQSDALFGSVDSWCWTVMSFWKTIGLLVVSMQSMFRYVCRSLGSSVCQEVYVLVGTKPAGSACEYVGQQITWCYTCGFDGCWVSWYMGMLVCWRVPHGQATFGPKIALHYKNCRGLLWHGCVTTGTSKKKKYDPVGP